MKHSWSSALAHSSAHKEPSVYVYTIPCEFASMEFTLYIDGTVTMSTWMHISK